MVWEGCFSVAVPAGWDCDEVDGTVSFYDPDGVGAVQVSFAAGPNDADVDIDWWSEKFADEQGLAEVKAVNDTLGGLKAIRFEALTKEGEPAFWRVWHCGSNGRVATVSYTCAADDAEVERIAVDRLLASIRWLI